MHFIIKKFLFKFKYLRLIFLSKKLNKHLKKNFLKKKELFIKEISKKKYSNTWFLNNFHIFHNFFPKNTKKKFSYLEIGSFEGLSLNNVLYHYRNSVVYAIDLWNESNLNSDKLKVNFSKVEKVFDRNLKEYNFTKLKSDSVSTLRSLIRKKIFFDIIYIDGSHKGEDILSDAIESYKLLKLNGLIFFDDINAANKFIHLQPFEGFDIFCNMYKKKIKIKFLDNIAVIKKIS